MARSCIIMPNVVVKVTSVQRRKLESIVARSGEAAGFVRRVRVILLSADGVSGKEIALRLGLTAEAVSRIRTRYRREGVAGLDERKKTGRKDHAVPAETVERVIQLAMSPPPAGRSRWTTRLLGREVGLSSGCVSDILRRHELKPHLTRTYKVSRDPEFASKVEDVVGLYLNPPRERDCAQRRRKNVHPSARTNPTSAAASLRSREASHARLQEARGDRLVRRS